MDDIKNYLLYPAIVVLLSAIVTSVWTWTNKRISARLKNNILQYLGGKGVVKTSQIIKDLFDGKEPKNLESILRELAKDEYIKDVPFGRVAPFTHVRRLR